MLSTIIFAEEFAARSAGFSIGSNDLTQLVLGVDRDSGMQVFSSPQNPFSTCRGSTARPARGPNHSNARGGGVAPVEMSWGSGAGQEMSRRTFGTLSPAASA